LRTSLENVPRELKLFASATFLMGLSFSLVDTVMNNFLNARFALSGFERSFLEFPRELPGFLVIFVTALLWFLCSRRLGAVAMLVSSLGVLLIGLASSSYWIMTLWMFLYTLGSHVFMPVSSTIGMELAQEGKAGQRLGQLNAIKNLAAIIGSGVIFLGFNYLGMTFQNSFVLGAAGLAIAGLVMFKMKPEQAQQPAIYMKLHREYKWYYMLAVLFGSRKQLFITFAPWVLITVFKQPTQTLATLAVLGGLIGILFQPFLGWAIDRLGERSILASEAVILVFVCFGYGFARIYLPENTAFYITCICYLLDQMLFAVGIARSTYIKKIARDPSHIQPALTISVTIDHIFSIAIALIGGLIWNTWGYQYVFMMGALIAVVNFFVALQARIPQQQPV
jgi:predicted MFS family arabinose efflux permease